MDTPWYLGNCARTEGVGAVYLYDSSDRRRNTIVSAYGISNPNASGKRGESDVKAARSLSAKLGKASIFRRNLDRFGILREYAFASDATARDVSRYRYTRGPAGGARSDYFRIREARITWFLKPMRRPTPWIYYTRIPNYRQELRLALEI